MRGSRAPGEASECAVTGDAADARVLMAGNGRAQQVRGARDQGGLGKAMDVLSQEMLLVR